MLELGNKGEDVFEDTINNIGKVRTIAQTLEIISIEKDLLTIEMITTMIELNLQISKSFCKTLKEKKFVTFKQIELYPKNQLIIPIE